MLNALGTVKGFPGPDHIKAGPRRPHGQSHSVPNVTACRHLKRWLALRIPLAGELTMQTHTFAAYVRLGAPLSTAHAPKNPRSAYCNTPAFCSDFSLRVCSLIPCPGTGELWGQYISSRNELSYSSRGNEPLNRSKAFGSPRMWRGLVEGVAGVTDMHCRCPGGWASQFGS
jgi:hypothetical protein